MALTVLGAALRFATLDTQSFWSDEAVTAGLLQHGFGDMLRAIPDSESTPPLYYVLAWLWTQVFGLSEAGVRSLSALAGTLTIPVAAWLGTRAVSLRAGVVTAALVAVNPLLWWYSQEARSYALVVLLTAAATAAFAGFARDRRGAWTWAIASVLALATHYFAMFIVGPQAVWLAWRWWSGRRAPLAPPVVVAVAGAALLPLLVGQASNRRADFISSSGSLAKRIAQVPKQFLTGFDSPHEVLVTGVAVVLALSALVLAVTRTNAEERRGIRLLALVAAGGVVVPALLAAVGVDYLIARNVIPALVPALALLGGGFGASRAGRAGVVAAVALCALSAATIIAVDRDKAYQRDDWRGVARALGPATTNRVIVVTPPDGAVALHWYLPRSQTTGADVTAPELDMVGVGPRVAGQKPRPPRGPYPTPQGFSVVRTVEAPTFTALVTRAPAPVLLPYAFSSAQRLSPSFNAAVIYQER